MEHATQVQVIERLLANLAAPAFPHAFAESTVATSAYTDPARLAAERAVLFRTQPLAVAHASEIAAAGDYVTADVAGVPVLAVRGPDGVARAFVNACRHRGTRLATEPRGHAKKSLVCRYHAWSYDLRGALTHVPQRETFPTLECANAGLIPLPLAERHGWLWVVPSAGAQGAAALPTPDIAAHLGPELDRDLAAFGLERHHAYRRVVQTRRCNWKLVIEAFLEGYHARYLHQATVARFFLTDGALIEPFGRNVRSVGARREIREAPAVPRERWDIRALATVFYFVFPNTVLVFHPDWVSHITMAPETLETATYTHTMLIPALPATDPERAHWDKTFGLIEDAVFQREDLAVAESIQSTLGAGAEERFRLGKLEYAIRHFHDAIESALRAASTTA